MVMKTKPIEFGSHMSRRISVALLACAWLVAPLTSQASCLGMVLHAHRGGPDAPENSLSSVRQAVQGPWDGAEIDIQQLRDGNWVLHHDAQLGRTTSLRGRRVADLDSTMWKEIRLKDRKGRITSEGAPFLGDVSEMAGAQNGKVLNVEIKQSNGDCGPARQAAGTLSQAMPNGQWFLTSIDRRQLQCARQFDRTGYLGQIVLDPQALASDSDNRWARLNANRLKPPVLDQTWLSRLQQDVGKPVGVHIDINTLLANPGLLPAARAMGIPVFTYDLTSDKEHAQALLAAKRQSGLLPSGAIINGRPDAFCQLMSAP